MTDSITPLDTSTLRQNVRLLGDSLGEVYGTLPVNTYFKTLREFAKRLSPPQTPNSQKHCLSNYAHWIRNSCTLLPGVLRSS